MTAGGHPEIPALLLVTGPPAAGKTTIAAALAERLDLPLLAKDTLKEALAGPLGVIEQAGSRRLGAAVFELLELDGALVRVGTSPWPPLADVCARVEPLVR